MRLLRPAACAALVLGPRFLAAQSETIAIEPAAKAKLDGSIVALAFSARGDSVAAATERGRVRLIDAKAGGAGRELLADGGRITAMARTRDDARLAVGNERGEVKVVEQAGGAPRSVKVGEPVTALAFSPSGNVIAVGLKDGQVVLVSAGTGAITGRLRNGHRKSVLHVGYLRDGATLLSVGADRDIVYWDVKKLEKLRQVQEPDPTIMSAGATPSGDLLFVGTEEFSQPAFGQGQPTYRDGLRIYDVASASPQKVLDLQGQNPAAMAGAPDCRHVAVILRDKRGSTLALVDVERGTRVYSTPTPGRSMAVAFASDGRTIAVANEDGEVSLLAVRGVQPRPRCIADLKGVKYAITGSRTPLVSPSHKVNFAVLDLDDNGVGKELARAMSDQLTTRIGLNPGVRLLERRRIADLLHEQDFQKSGRTDAATAIQLGRIFNVHKAIVGGIAKLGTTLTITVQLVDVETGRIEGSREVQCNSCELEDLGLAMSELAQVVVAEPVAGAAPMPEPPSLKLDSPRDGDTLSGSSVTLRGDVTYSRPISGVELIVNGKPVDASRLLANRTGKLTKVGDGVQTFSFVQEVPLKAAANVIAVRVIGADGNDEQRILTVRRAPEPARAVRASVASTPPGIGLAELESGIKSRVPSARLVKIVGQFGVDFAWSGATESRLREAGADGALVAAVKRAKRVSPPGAP